MKLAAEKPKYRFCWACGRRLYGGRGRRVTVNGQEVWVHASCVAQLEKETP